MVVSDKQAWRHKNWGGGTGAIVCYVDVALFLSVKVSFSCGQGWPWVVVIEARRDTCSLAIIL